MDYSPERRTVRFVYGVVTSEERETCLTPHVGDAWWYAFEAYRVAMVIDGDPLEVRLGLDDGRTKALYAGLPAEAIIDAIPSDGTGRWRADVYQSSQARENHITLAWSIHRTDCDSAIGQAVNEALERLGPRA